MKKLLVILVGLTSFSFAQDYSYECMNNARYVVELMGIQKNIKGSIKRTGLIDQSEAARLKDIDYQLNNEGFPALKACGLTVAKAQSNYNKFASKVSEIDELESEKNAEERQKLSDAAKVKRLETLHKNIETQQHEITELESQLKASQQEYDDIQKNKNSLSGALSGFISLKSTTDQQRDVAIKEASLERTISEIKNALPRHQETLKYLHEQYDAVNQSQN